MLARTTTHSRRSPLTQCGHSNEIAAPLSIRETPLPVSGAVILALVDERDAVDWCQTCCVDRWSYETTDFLPIQLGMMTVPVYCFYFVSRNDMQWFSKAYYLQMKLALEVLEA